jgi:hypothetical protein
VDPTDLSDEPLHGVEIIMDSPQLSFICQSRAVRPLCGIQLIST